jgi:hypothetical protein
MIDMRGILLSQRRHEQRKHRLDAGNPRRASLKSFSLSRMWGKVRGDHIDAVPGLPNLFAPARAGSGFTFRKALSPSPVDREEKVMGHLYRSISWNAATALAVLG